MRTEVLWVSIAAMVALTGTAAADSRLAGVTMPDTIAVDGKPLTLNGMGLREATFLKLDVYVAGLYVERVSSNPGLLIARDEVKQLVLRFVRDVDRSDIVKAWNDGFRNNATVPIKTIQPLIDQFDGWMPAFRKGDTLMMTYVPGQGVNVKVNNVQKGVINQADFARSLFAIWLGARPPTGDLRRGLLGNHPRT
ncbi:MAG: chalcone isomerase family protein [Proteobacteria bacterium]|nr:chalcone isomerase family protein [Pseudomonadota bacterium]